jgi:putative membrane protein
MNNRILIALAGTTLALAACGKHDNANTTADGGNAADVNMATDNGSAASTATAPALTTARGFVNGVAASDRFEIESSKLAAAAASSTQVKRFAATMITAHTASTAKLKSALAGMNPPLTPDDTLTADQQQKLDGLKPLKGAAFDSAYVSAQSQGHQTTLDMLKNYSASGDNATLKTFANGLIPTVTAHLNMAKSLNSAMAKDLNTNDKDTNLSNGM